MPGDRIQYESCDFYHSVQQLQTLPQVKTLMVVQLSLVVWVCCEWLHFIYQPPAFGWCIALKRGLEKNLLSHQKV